MHELFFKKIREKISLSEEDEQLMRSHLIPKKIRKKQYLLQEGDVCKYGAFVEKGMLRSYTIADNGNEHIVQFAPEGWYISDLYSCISGEPATQNIDAIEDSELILLRFTSQEYLIQKIPQYEHFVRLQMQGAYIALQKRLTSMFNLTTEEKYARFLNIYPDIVQRVPQHMIASYLGLTPETLSRSRKRKMP